MSAEPDRLDYDSPTVPEGALFVEADEPLLVYPSARAAERHLEVIDVENRVYPAAYGPNGEPYRIVSDGRRVIVERSGEPDRPDALKTLLIRYLDDTVRPASEAEALSDLVAEVWRTESAFWKERDPHGEQFGSRIPLWGCLLVIALLAAALYFAFG